MCPWHSGNFQISAGFCLLAVWFAVANGVETLAIVLSAAAIHEAGHYLVLHLGGAQVSGIRLSVFGAVMETQSRGLSYGRELAAVLAGPAANLLCGLLLAGVGNQPMLAGAHLVLCIFNLLPVRPLDGGRALELAVSWAAGPAAGDQAARWIGAATALVLAAAVSGVVWCSGGSLWLLPAAVGLAGAAAGEILGKP